MNQFCACLTITDILFVPLFVKYLNEMYFQNILKRCDKNEDCRISFDEFKAGLDAATGK